LTNDRGKKKFALVFLTIKAEPNFLDNISMILRPKAGKTRNKVSSPSPKEYKAEQAKIKDHAYRFFFDKRGIIHLEYVPEEQSVNEAYNPEVLQ
jgi:hypothetical protein